MKSIARVYNVWGFCVSFCFCILAAFFTQGCAFTLTAGQKKAKQEDVVKEINAARQAEGVVSIELTAE